MKWISVAITGLAATASATIDESGAVHGMLSPDGQPPVGCARDYNGMFQVTVYAAGDEKPNLEKRSSCDNDQTLIMTLADGVLMDAKERTGYIASNFQFQFDNPPQSGAIYTGGFSLCGNNSVALGSSTVFSRCLSGHFYNLYDRHWAPQCDPVEIVAMPCAADGGEIEDQDGSEPIVVGTSTESTTVVKTLDDGQPQVVPTVMPIAMCQIGDGQVQFHTTPCASVTRSPLPAPISQIPDGQPQAPSHIVPVPHSQVSQIPDGQPQAPKVSPQPSQGLPSAPLESKTAVKTSPAPRITSSPVVTQIPDGQPQLPTSTFAAPDAPSAITAGAAKRNSNAMAALIAALLAVAPFLR
ncbi:hypothetical protein CDD81_7283 [Ophiocordyceps australis]|uniref:Cell wall mannoprotein PIR1-like C-terminal domain-containing protein n=1 Tax=Ophiocordyceps australis TaxID=1399860 RepID=A0A2C5XYF3_9HYPO|nr:hypothetical protein CDD81_7283 [Ophiocordyceps australis]